MRRDYISLPPFNLWKILGGCTFRVEPAMQLTVGDAARLLDTTEDRIYAWIDDGSIPAYEVDEQHRFNRSELLEWATARGMRVSVEIFAARGDAIGAGGFAGALAAGGVHYAVPSTDRETLIRAISELLPIRDEAERELVTDVLLARHALETAVGGGIAIPHVRNPIIVHGCRAAIVLAFLARPIALDELPIHTIFLMVTPTPKSHLHLLSRLSAALHDPAFKAALVQRAPADDVLREARRVEESFGAPEAVD